MTIPEFVGYTGVALLIVTYALLQLDRIDPKGFWYSFNNLLVAILVTVSLIETPNKPSMVIEFFWFLISAYGIAMFYKRSKTKEPWYANKARPDGFKFEESKNESKNN
jgi:hypothetical protein